MCKACDNERELIVRKAVLALELGERLISAAQDAGHDRQALLDRLLAIAPDRRHRHLALLETRWPEGAQ